ncbi:MAG: TonB-dependent receptor [Salibacteraceae bacterium]|nr:TonB-dependent receptor [Salibacteraceae bacterium]MDP4687488.1 TonB-dependent receptor [Salibacteraceae bacterium]MDP4762517.1 TonB-dependent receptor [Salibacteraceae bacterium]MDP4844805.1 TonB-dependent receptor [Salibacteraceae bacterium]MDP4964860.1 TonB-dependent receptor [Salibacteraceae bacterium]
MRILLFALFIALQTVAMAQSGTIRGFVYDRESGEPIIFTNVFLKGTQQGASTDVNGYYSITKITPGDYTVLVTALGYDTASEKISIKNGQVLNVKLFIATQAQVLGTVEVSADKVESQNEVKMSVQKITPKEIAKLPSVGGEADIAQYMQVLPGVVFTGDQGGQLYIRGGSPVQNKVLLDGMIVYNPFHSIGLFSVFDTDIIRNADVYTGGYSAEYGGRISSVMDITTIDGNYNETHGNLSLTTFGGKLNLEGPLMRPKTLGGSSISGIASLKHSYLDQSSKLLYTYIDEDGLPFNYTDAYGKITFSGENGSKANVFGLAFTDNVQYQSISDLNWRNLGAGANFLLIPTGNPVLIDGNIAYSNYSIFLDVPDRNQSQSKIAGFNGSLNFTYFMGDDDLKYGIEVVGFSTDYTFYNSANRLIQQQESTTELAVYAKYKKKIGNLVLDPSVRLHYYASLRTPSFEPRIGAKWNLTDNIRLKGAAGVYSQNLIAANSDRDVVNLFNGYLSGPDNLQKTFTDENGNTRDVKHALQKANHFIIGSEFDVSKRIKVNVEGYYKFFSQLTNINRNKIFADNKENADRADVFKKDFIIETGRAYGVDFVLKYDVKNLNLYAVYSLGKVTRWDGIQTYAPVFDRRHNVNFVGSYEFGENRAWEADVRWNMGSGFPFTQTVGFYEQYNFDGENSDLLQSNGDVGVIYDKLNGGRLPYYHRLDLTLKRTFALSVNSQLVANIGVTNAYNRENIFYFDRINFERVNQLPFMPSAGIALSF